MRHDEVKMNAIPVVAETSVAARDCHGCGKPAIFKLAFRTSDASQQGISWCNECAYTVMKFLEARVETSSRSMQ